MTEELPSGFEFHHIGYACTSIDNDAKLFSFFGYEQEGDTFTDETQGVKGCFMVGNGPRIELLENLPASDTLTPWLDSGIKMYHMAYLVEDVCGALEWVCAQRARVIVRPVPAAAFDGREIAFVMFRGGFLLEFIERA